MQKILPILTAFFILAFYLGGKNESRRNLQVHPVAVAHQPAGSQNDDSSSEKSYSQKTIEELIVETFPDEPEMALSIAKAESGLKSDAVSKTGDYGIFQINLKSHWNKIEGRNLAEKIEKLKEPIYNVNLAKKIQNQSYWWPWTAYKTNRYLAFYE